MNRKKLLSLVILALLLPVFIWAQTGTVYDELTLESKILKSERKFALYLPPDYDSSKRSYPILYLLHGGGDDQTGWVQFGEVLRITDECIKNGTATPMIIAMPDADTGRRGYFNTIDGEWRYEDFFFDEFMPFVEKNYRVKSEKRYRAIAGLSMGGGGTLMYTLHHPELFSSACPLSASCGPLNLEQMRQRLERRKQNNVDKMSDEQIQKYYEKHSAVQLMENMDAKDIKSVRWYFDCGDDDFLFEGNSLIHITLRKREIPHEFRIRDGAHNWTYWRESLPQVLKFVSDAFHQH